MKKKHRIKGVILIILLLAGVGFTIAIIFSNREIKQENDETITTSATNNIPVTKQEEEKQKTEQRDAKLKDWRLILVNKENDAPEDYSIELAKVENGYQVDKRILESVSKMLKDIRKEGLEPWICSAYRSSATQKRLFNNKVEYYKKQGHSEETAKEKASYWIAIPGTSEHEMGLSLDIVSKNYQLLDKKQEETPEQKWLMEHCYEYGFVMRYPPEKKEITKIDYEPWHYRYVGIDNAKVMKENNFCLEEYIEYLKGK